MKKIKSSLFFCCLGGWLGLNLLNVVQAQEPILKIGVIQRFGDEVEDQIKITSTKGDKLTLTLTEPEGKTKTLTTTQVTLEILSQTQKQPVIEERLVLSDHATFETAEASAKQWQARGIKTEITQPGRWQVWAKRDVYNTVLVRRWLLQNLKAQGYDRPYLETNWRQTKPIVSFLLNGTRYNLHEFSITSQKNLIRVQQTEDGEELPLRLYGGNLLLQPNAYGDFTLVNNVPLETYLRGVVPYEIGPSAPATAMQAQTIIARTYALRNLRRFTADNYELCATVHCQVYKGLGNDNPKADQAITLTKGLVLTYQNELVDALYSSTTGGITASFTDIWNGETRPYLQPVIDSPSSTAWNLAQKSLAEEINFRNFIALQQGFNETKTSRVFRWRKQSKLADLTKDLQKYLAKQNHPLANLTRIDSMTITKRSDSGRVLEMAIATDVGEIKLHKTEVRSAFTPPISTLFYLEPLYDNQQKLIGYTFVGGGYGHGVGLSQYGSYNLAGLGWSAEKILEFYYPGTQVQPLNEKVVFYPK
ncbi:MAG: SpoIID/LytB domain-containing protein [Cyanobacteria bacterium J083]|nr:MAG: SpoIID/LytB domain-containing protein [Cyanobacteria bacterium J083]